MSYNQHNGKCVIFSAPSGAGKTTIVRHLLDTREDLEFSISATSRAPRKKEREGKDYHYLSVAEFKAYIEAGAFVEWEEVYNDQFYGTLHREIERIWEMNKHVIFDVDVQGGLNLKKSFGDTALAVFVMPPNLEALEARLRGRDTETEKSIRRRMGKAAQELAVADSFDVILINDDLETAKQEASELIADFLEV
ncbi:MAG: guanylate kinase [Flavobacteriales bacterium]|nr:guanylate kinase [Flavobacteriales bacterium]